jgi:hypothetical protein
VVANHHRKALVLDYLHNIPHKVSYTLDYELPENFKPEVFGLVQPHCHLGHIRCFKGHQQAIKLCDTDNVLIFEDDAVPNIDDWHQIILDSVHLLDHVEMVSFHGRDYARSLYENFEEIRPGNHFIKPLEDIGRICMHGALAYMVNKRTFDKILSWKYVGKPIDVMLVNKLSFCLLENSPFNHDRSEGSLLDV